MGCGGSKEVEGEGLAKKKRSSRKNSETKAQGEVTLPETGGVLVPVLIDADDSDAPVFEHKIKYARPLISQLCEDICLVNSTCTTFICL